MSDIDLVIMRSQVKRGIAAGIKDTRFLADLDRELKKREVQGAN